MSDFEGNDIPELKKDYCHEYVTKNGTKTSDPFEDALRVVIQAKHASHLAEAAQREADIISGLAGKAQARADSLGHISSSLYSTAATVTTTALRICSYDSFEDAYVKNPNYVDTISKEELSDILSTSEKDECVDDSSRKQPDNDASMSQRVCTSTVSSPTHDQLLLTAPSGIQQKKGTKQMNLARKGRRTKAGSEEHLSELYRSERDDRVDSGPICFGKCRAQGTMSNISPPALNSSFRPIREEDGGYTSSPSLLVPTTEKHYKRHRGSAKHWLKDSMEASFDSSHSIAPLWEDRYFDDSGKMHVHTIYQPSESYTEKKAMRQFQLKLQNSCERIGRDRVDLQQSQINSGPIDELEKRMRGTGLAVGCENDSSDNEVENILSPKQNKTLVKVQDMEKIDKTTVSSNERLLTAKREDRASTVSPLLSSEQQGCYRMSAENSPSTSPLSHKKQEYTPETDKDKKE